jgi:hypothetical protein
MRRPAMSPRRRLFSSAGMLGASVAAALFVVMAADAQKRDAQQKDMPLGTPGGPIYKPPLPARNISGVWWTQSYSPKIQIEGGGDLPYNEEGKAQYAKNIAALKDGSLTDEARRFCVPDGLPRVLGNPYPFQVIQTPGQVHFLYELNHVVRAIAVDRAQPPADPFEDVVFFSGHPLARWDGDALVIETKGFKDTTFLDATGAPHSDMMTTVERVKKLNDTTLENVITVTDPEMFTRAWSARFVYDLHPEVRLEDYVCGEKHRDISKVKGVVVPQ